jgi:hypothetical protein
MQPLWKTIWWFLKKLKTELPFDPAIPLLEIYPKKQKAESKILLYLYTNVPTSIFTTAFKKDGNDPMSISK